MPTNVPWAFVFERVDMLPRHPAQLYEAIAYFIFFLGMVWLYKRGQKKQETKLETDFSTTKRKSTTVQAEASLPYYRFLLRPLPDGNLPLPFLHRVPERKPGEL